jgi:hypothetical protein
MHAHHDLTRISRSLARGEKGLTSVLNARQNCGKSMDAHTWKEETDLLYPVQFLHLGIHKLDDSLCLELTHGSDQGGRVCIAQSPAC